MTQLATKGRQAGLPAILIGTQTPAVRQRVESFFFSVASCFDAWVSRRQSPHTQRAYREDVMSFVKFMGLTWPDEAIELLHISIRDVLAFREHLLSRSAAPKTDRKSVV